MVSLSAILANMSSQRCGGVLLGCLLLLALPLTSAETISPEPTPAALERAAKLRATAMGVDRAGNLWVWNRNSHTLRAISAEGDLFLSQKVEGGFPATAVFDAEWGIAALDLSRHLLLRPPGADEWIRIPREGQASSLAWLGDGRLAVAPLRAEHRLEIWDLAKREVVARWGKEKPIPDGPGLHRVRGVLLAWDDASGRLWTLESFTGELVVFSAGGEEVLRRTIRHPDFERDQRWVEEQEARPAEENQDTTLNLFTSLSVEPGVAGWIFESCGSGRGGIEIVHVAADGHSEKRRQPVDGCCPSKALIWGSQLVFYRDARLPGEPCNLISVLSHSKRPTSASVASGGVARLDR